MLLIDLLTSVNVYDVTICNQENYLELTCLEIKYLWCQIFSSLQYISVNFF